ncbi:CRP-like cAMP-binding protein [Deinococcus metalli]|uniref:CRP-like cAMP-binding protein n=1 Tax=Deinococcus metalli TaxID=1141878 RepID=A0A7W8KHE6_9DEIO|nr:Crp/Fnr family transcriptional regulator [Deinococcus metalli]MBB5378264.1 CRP-like cAMP-binding protein [Deinococcus metalli]GHF57275.1 cyclic AMP receptor protein [Deinococcus metalli]
MSRLETLKRNPLLRDVPDAALTELAGIVTERHLSSGEVLISQDDRGEALHLLTEGVVRISRVSLGSRERVMGDVYAPGVLGETAVLSLSSERSATVTALTPVTTLMLYRDHFEQLLRRYPRMLWNLSRLLAERVTFLNDELIAFGMNTEAALSHVFTNLYRQRVQAGVPRPEVLPLSTQDIMLRISSSRETVSRVMRKLEKQNLVRMGAHGVTLLDPDGLDRIPLDLPDAGE